MKICIVGGFFLPMPAVAGGATEKTWTRLGSFFAQQGHDVTVISRDWSGLANGEEIEGVRFLRLRGYQHSSSLGWNLVKDFWWSIKVTFKLTKYDILVVNTVFLPVWVRWIRPRSGRLVIMTGRVPKGQYRLYSRVDLAVAASTAILKQVAKENAKLGQVGRIYGYPIDFGLLNQNQSAHPEPPSADFCIRIGFIGRIHREKGISQLIDALIILSRRGNLAPWKFIICGPVDVAQGGSGEAYLAGELQRLKAYLSADQIELISPEYQPERLAKIYRGLDIFVLPSLSENGETFGVAAVEAMAAGCAVITSRLACFRDYLTPEESGLSYNHRSPEAASLLASCLARLVNDADLRNKLAIRGSEVAQNYDFEVFGKRLLADFEGLSSKS